MILTCVQEPSIIRCLEKTQKVIYWYFPLGHSEKEFFSCWISTVGPLEAPHSIIASRLHPPPQFFLLRDLSSDRIVTSEQGLTCVSESTRHSLWHAGWTPSWNLVCGLQKLNLTDLATDLLHLNLWKILKGGSWLPVTESPYHISRWCLVTSFLCSCQNAEKFDQSFYILSYLCPWQEEETWLAAEKWHSHPPLPDLCYIYLAFTSFPSKEEYEQLMIYFFPGGELQCWKLVWYHKNHNNDHSRWWK